MNFTYRYHIWASVRAGCCCWLHMLNFVLRILTALAATAVAVATATALHGALFICAKRIEIESISYCIGRLAIAGCDGTKRFRRCLKYYAENSSWYQIFGYLIARFQFASKQLHWKCPSCKHNCCVHCTWIYWKNSGECAIGFAFRIFCFQYKHWLADCVWLYVFMRRYVCVCAPILTDPLCPFQFCGCNIFSSVALC